LLLTYFFTRRSWVVWPSPAVPRAHHAYGLLFRCVASMCAIPKNRSPDLFVTLRSWRRISRRPAHSMTGSSYRVVQRSPLRRLSFRCSLPHIAQRASAQRCQAPNMFRPRGFSPPRRFTPPNRLQACCIPHPTLGSTGLLLLHALAPSLAFPPVPLPSELFPLEQPCLTSPQALAPSSLPAATPTRPRGLAPLKNPLRSSAVASQHAPVTLLGFPSEASLTLSLSPS